MDELLIPSQPFIAQSILDDTGPPQMTNAVDQFRARGRARDDRDRPTASNVADVLRLCRSTRIIFSRVAGKMPKIVLRLFAVILALLGGLSARAAGAAEINVVCS